MQLLVKIILWGLTIFVFLMGIALYSMGNLFSACLFIVSAYCISPLSYLPQMANRFNFPKASVYLIPVALLIVAFLIAPMKAEEGEAKPPIQAGATPNGEASADVANKPTAMKLENGNITHQTPLNLREKIASNIFDPYTKKVYPKTFAKFGSRMPEVEKARQAAAFLALTNDRCKYVDLSEVSDKSTRKNIQIFTDCADEKKNFSERFRFKESELKDRKNQFFTENTIKDAPKARTILEQAFDKDAAILICQESVKNAAQFPSSVDFSIFGQTVNTSKTSGDTWVELEFEAKNGLGLELPYLASCTFPIHGEPTFEIKKR